MVRVGLLVGAFIIVCAAILADPRAPAWGQATPDLNLPVQVYADEISYDSELGIIIATGRVEISQGDRILMADTVTYNEKANLVAATGNVSLKEPTGETLFGDYVEMTGDLREGTIQNFRMLMADQSRLVASGAQRLDGNRTILRRGVYSPCDLCRDNPSRAPLWQVKARRVEHDQQAQEVYYRDAWLEVGGIPLFYTPYFSHPDPTVKRKSGFLAPQYSASKTLGSTFTVPYYWAVTPNLDLTFEPTFTTNAGQMIAGEYRQRFARGEIEASASAVSAPRVDDSNNRIGGDEFRGHFKGRGRFDINDDWRWGFDAARSTDDTYLARYRLLRRYGFPSAVTLTSRAYVEGFDGPNYAAVNAYAFQGLRPADDPGQSPIVLPMFEYSYLSDPRFFGGRVNVDANALSILRTDGTDTRRFSVRTGWSRPYVAPAGDIYTLQAQLQTDLYSVDNANKTSDRTLSGSDGINGRALPTVGLNWRYPFVRSTESYQQYLEPTAAVYVSPNGGSNRRIPNEDSRSFDLDYTNLLALNRFGGVDRVEGGQRVVYGLTAGMKDFGIRSVSGFIGQSLQWNTDDFLIAGSGIDHRSSDIVGRVNVVPFANTSLNYAFRLDESNLDVVRSIAGFSVGPPALRIDGSYLFIDRSSTPQFSTNVEQLGLRLTTRLTENWSAQVENLRDFAGIGNLRWAANLVYSDECIVAGLFYTRRFIGDRDNPPDSTIFLRVVFRNLGEIAPKIF